MAAFLNRHPDLLPPDAPVLVALSGGSDSTALLHLLTELAGERGWRLFAAHLDHGVRPESAEQAAEVAARAEAAGVPCAVGRAPPDMSRTQAAFRRERYRFLRREARRTNAVRIATGHQADDQAETVLFRILRGTGLKGLGGIPLRRGPLVRPLLAFERSELQAWLRERGIPWTRDPSNEDPRWTRARLRHEVMPLLEEVAGHPVGPRLRALARAARRAERALERTAAAALRDARLGGDEPPINRIARDRLLAYDREIQARAIRQAARSHGISLTRGGTRAAVEFIKRGRSGAAVDLGDRLRLAREFDVLRLGPPPRTTPDRTWTIGAEPGGAEVAVGGRRYGIRWGPGRPDAGEARRRDAARVVLPLAGTAFPLTFRGPRPGDRILLAGGTRKLKKAFGEHRVPRSERPRVPVLEDAEGRLLWAAGVGRARFAVPSPSEETFIVVIEQPDAAAAAERVDA